MFNLKKSSSPGLEEKLDKIIFHWPVKDGKKEAVRIADMLRGTQIFGGTGSGKSSGSGNRIAKAFLKQNFGGIILCAKPDEGKRWKKYIEDIGREKEMVYFNEKSNLQFNPILYEERRGGDGAGETLNLVDLIMNIQQLGQNYRSASGGGTNEGFWDNALRRSISRSIELLKLSKVPITIPNMRKVMVSALKPKHIEQYQALLQQLNKSKPGSAAEKEVEAKVGKLRKSNYCFNLLIEAQRNVAKLHHTGEEEKQIALNRIVQDYFFSEFAYLSDRTRSSIEEYFYGLVEPFTTSGILQRHFGQGISPELWPENTYRENKIIILDFPVKDYLIAGIYAQGIYKYMWQQAMERRRPYDQENDGNQNPVFLWVDESHYFINPNYDTLFQTTARSSLVCTVYLTQSLNNYLFTMGSQSPEARAKGLLANMGNKIFHANTDVDTNKWASEMIGQNIALLGSGSARLTSSKDNTVSEHLLPQVLPREFTTLRYGRMENNKKVEAYIVKIGPWANTDKNYIKVEFTQD